MFCTPTTAPIGSRPLRCRRTNSSLTMQTGAACAAVVLVERPAAHEVDPERPEVAGADDLIVRRRASATVSTGGSPTIVKPWPMSQPSSGRLPPNAALVTPGIAAMLALRRLVERVQLFRAAVPVQRQAELHRQHVLRAEAGIDAVQRDQRADEQSGAGQQQHRGRDLADDERRAQAAGAPVDPRPPALVISASGTADACHAGTRPKSSAVADASAARRPARRARRTRARSPAAACRAESATARRGPRPTPAPARRRRRSPRAAGSRSAVAG